MNKKDQNKDYLDIEKYKDVPFVILNNNFKPLDKEVKNLSDMQMNIIESNDISSEEKNNILEMIGDLKDYMINCDCYKNK